MLNEGYHLYKSLERCGIKPGSQHPDIKEPGKKDGLILGIDEKGKIASIEFRKGDEIASLWTIMKGNHGSFPVIKLQRPLWDVGPDDVLRKKIGELKKDETKKRNLIFQQSIKLNITKHEKNWWKRLHERVTDLQSYFKTTNKNYIAFEELIIRFKKAVRIDEFLKGFLDKIIKYKADIPYSIIENIFIGNKWDEKKKEYRSEVPLVLDVSDWDNKYRFSARVASPKMVSFVSECLSKMHATSGESKKMGMEGDGKNGISALSGKEKLLEDNKFPNPKLPVIGPVFLFAVNDQTPCQARYGKTSTGIIPVGRKEAQSIQDSLKWITSDERHEKTWYQVPGLHDGEPNLLIVYLEDKPDLKVNKAYLLGGQSSNDLSEATFEAVAGNIIKAYKGDHIIKANDQVRLFALRKADLGRKQIVLHRSCTVVDIINAAELWQAAAGNIPEFSLPFPGKKGEKAIILKPICLFPADFVRLTQRQWHRLKEENEKNKRPFSKATGASLGQIYNIFFDQKNKLKREVSIILGLTLRRTLLLLDCLGEAIHKNNILAFNIEARFSALITISAISILLHKLGISKEDYMKSSLFYVGRLLALVDTLHLEYCKHIRKGNIPPQLLGNAHLNVSLSNPTSALARLSQRIGIYQAWTRKEQGEEAKLARWAVGEIGKVTNELSNKELPVVTADADKAQILLGYLAMPSKSASGNINNSTNQVS